MLDAGLVLRGLKVIWDAVSGSKKIKKVDEKYFGNSQIRRNFLNQNKNAVFVNVQGDLYMGDKNYIPKKKILEVFDGNPENKQVDIIDTDFYDRIQKYNKGFGSFEKIEKYLTFLDLQIQAVLKMAVYAENLYSVGDRKEAEIVRADIGEQYGRWGRKLSNLYLSGYINALLDYLVMKYSLGDGKLNCNFNDEIRDFVNDSDYIYFISESLSLNELILSIKEKINSGVSYIAIHAAGRNIEIGKKIMNEIRDYSLESSYKVEEEKKKAISGISLYYSYITKKHNSP